MATKAPTRSNVSESMREAMKPLRGSWNYWGYIPFKSIDLGRYESLAIKNGWLVETTTPGGHRAWTFTPEFLDALGYEINDHGKIAIQRHA